MFRRGFRIWWFVGAMVCVAGVGGGIAYWVSPKPKQKTFVDFPTTELHATCWLREGEYGEDAVFLTAKQIDELKGLVASAKPWVLPKASRGGRGLLIFDADIQFYRDGRRLNHLIFIKDSFITVNDWKNYHQRLEVNRGDYAQFLSHCFETYRQKRLQSEETQ